MPRLICISLLAFFFCTQCSTRKFEEGQELVLHSTPSALSDDLGTSSLLQAIETQISYYDSQSSNRFPKLRFGKRSISKEAYRESLRYLLQSTRAAANPEQSFEQNIKDNFDFYAVYGEKSEGDIFLTSYFEPEIKGSLTKTQTLSQALYRMPEDMVEIDLTKFSSLGSDFPRKSLVGRLSPQKNAQGQPVILPYFSRNEIDRDLVLANRKLEIVWVDPIDAFFLHIQGSGTVVLDSGVRLRAIYASQNGHKYEALGAFLKDAIPAGKITAHSIETYLRTLGKEKLLEILGKNPSYIFFKESQESAITFSGISAIDGRSLATDTRYFPKGALCFLKFPKPIFESPEAIEPLRFDEVSRFTFDHDKGGAINGLGRADLFWGRGASAKQASGVIKHRATLYYLVPKESLLKRLPL